MSAGHSNLAPMTAKSPRNKTLALTDAQLDEYLKQCPPLGKSAKLSEIEDRVLNQEILDALKYLPSDSIDLLLVDPPYNLTKQYGENKFAKVKFDEYEIWFEEWIVALKRLLKPNASIYVCTDWESSKTVQTVLEKHFKVRNRITWEREKGRGAKANWKNCSEDIWFATMSNDYYFDVEAVKLKRKVIAPYRDSSGAPKDWDETEDGNYRLTFPSNLWTDITLPFWSMLENTDHPTQKPEKLIAKLILASSKEGDLVFDPFMGSGTTCVVANKLGRKYLGIDKEPKYCAYAIERLKRAKSNKSIQGYHDGYFWERNSLSDQKGSKKVSQDSELYLENLFDE
jgi:site-specific DNA-methyltransferase (adenine-specific)